MIKKSSINLDTPAHQPLVSIIVIFWKSFGSIIKSFWPLIFIYFMNSKSGNNLLLIIGSVGLALISFFFGMLRYYNFLYHFENKNLVISSGLFTKVTKNIPFERIQSIRLEQKFVHRLLNLYSVRIDTAGSAKEEIEIPALDYETANKIKNNIAQFNQANVKSKRTQKAKPIAEEEEEELVFKLSLSDILKLGLTANHIRNFFIILGVLIGISTQLGEFDSKYRLDRWIEYAIDNSKKLTFEWEYLLVVPAVVIISMLVSILFSLFTNFNLRVRKSETGYRVNQGLINRKEQFAPYKKIQIFRWAISPLRYLLGLYNVSIKQASSSEMSIKKSIRIPGAPIEDVNHFLDRVFKGSQGEATQSFDVHHKFLYRYFIYVILIPVAVFAGIYFYVDIGFYMILAIVWAIFGTLALGRYYNSWRITLGKTYLQLGRGVLTMRRDRIFIHKLQGLKVHQTPYQIRHDLATVVLHTAAGDLSIPYVTLSDAYYLSNYLLYKVESSRRAWM